jgi:diaminopimelate epimerase
MMRQTNKTHKGWLMSGAGNTFAVEITDRDQKISSTEARKICEQFKVDGYLGLIETGLGEFQWNFFNSDGSDAEFCGNAARCAQDYVNRNRESDKTEHETVAGVVASWTKDGQNWVLMPEPKILDRAKVLLQDGHSWTGFWCNTGVPHFVLPQPKLRHDVWLETSRKLRHHPDLGARGANITWIVPAAEKLNAVTYERGVENFTQACGTGAIAAALWWQDQQKSKHEFQVVMPGGPLTIIHDDNGWRMTGPVEKLGDWSFL